MSTEIITDQEYVAVALESAAEVINEHIDLITQHEDSFNESTLEPRLIIGLEIAKAQEAFGMSNEGRARLGGETKAALSRRDIADGIPAVLSANPLGFTAWIGKNIPRLNRTTALKYATAFRSLGISTNEANVSRIRAKIKDLRHHAGKSNLPMPTLNTLYKQGKPAPSKEPLKIEGPADTPQMRLEDARESFHLWKEQFETMLRRGQLDDLDRKGLEDIKEFLAGARDRINARLKK